MRELFETRSEYYKNSRRVPIAVYQPKVKNENSRIAVLAMHGGDYMAFPPMVELAKRGFITAGANPNGGGGMMGPRADHWTRMQDVGSVVEFMKNYPGVEKLVLMGHSNGGCLMSSYQYIAENGVDRFRTPDRFFPVPEMPALPKADGLMLLDANYGIMDMLAMDPAVVGHEDGWTRIPELDIYNPENGYKKDASEYSQEFITRFQKAQVKYYQDLIDYCKERYELIQKGKGRFVDDEPILLPGSGGGSSSNKLFIQDTRLLGCTKEAHPLLHGDGSITNEVIVTKRLRSDSPASNRYRMGSTSTTVVSMLSDERKFGDFGYDSSYMWGENMEFNPMSTRANVQGITVPLLCQGNTASHEFINTEMTYNAAKSQDKSIVFLSGAHHMFLPEKKAEKFPGEFGDTLNAIVDYMADWLLADGRF